MQREFIFLAMLMTLKLNDQESLKIDLDAKFGELRLLTKLW